MKQNGWRRGWLEATLRRPGDLRMTLLAAAMIVASFAMPVEAQGERTARVSASSANVRSGCSLSAAVIASAKQDERVTVLGTLGEWHRVRLASGAEGCMHESVLEVLSDAVLEPAAGAEGMAAEASPGEAEYAWAQGDEDAEELLAEREELLAALAAAADEDEAADLRDELAEVDMALGERQSEIREERLEAQAAWEEERREAELEVRHVAEEDRKSATRNAGRRQRSGDTNWSGFYLGVNAGYGFGDDVSAFNSLGTSPEGDVDGFDGGVQIGYSHQFRRFVLGAEADYQLSNQSGTSDLETIGFPGSSIEFQYDSFGTVRVRAGFAVGRALLYATGGYAYAEADVLFAGPIADLVPNESANLEGWAAGVGAETVLTERLSLKTEALFHEFDEEPAFEDIGNSEFFSARVGLNWHF